MDKNSQYSFDPVAKQREWLPSLLWITIPLLLGTIIFWSTDLDRQIIALFYHPDNPVHSWPLAQNNFWRIVYDSAPYLVALLITSGLVLLLISRLNRAKRHLWIYGLFILLSLAIGPGLVVNAILKDNTGRPRPRQIVEFGGDAQYLPPLFIGKRGEGYSFPSGHGSVGFIFSTFWFIWHRRNTRAARGAMVFTLAAGGLLSFQRLISGSHFPSDILWAAGLCFLVPHLLYYFVLKIPRWENKHYRN